MRSRGGDRVKKSVLVVGAGVIGCSLAHEFTRRGAAVTVIDAAEAGSGTSSATFAWVNANNKSPAEYDHLNVLGLQAHERAKRSSSLAGPGWFHQIGNVQLAATAGEMAALEQKVEHLVSTGYEASLLTAPQVRELEPALQSGRLAGGALYPKEGWIDTITMCSSLLNRARASGAEFAPFETVTDITGTRLTTKTTDGSIRHHDADAIVLAAGNGTRTILAAAGIDFPTRDPNSNWNNKDRVAAYPTVGLISTTGRVDSGIRHIVRADGIAMRPARNGGVTFTDSPTGGKWNLNDPRIWTVPGLLLERARELYPSLQNASTETVRLGTRVLPEDGLTISDWINEDHSIYAVATHSGVTLAAHLAEVVTDELLTGTRHASLHPFGLSRFAN
jgi:glycine/D-amino acid oxidase-like deaminating enzyme